MSDQVRALVIGHAELPAALVAAVEQITGNGSRLLPMSCSDLGMDGIMDRVSDLVGTHGVRTIFTDLPAGSGTMAVRRLQKRIPWLTVVTGVNLAALLDFVQRDEPADDPAEDVVSAVEAAHSAVQVFGVPHVD